MHDAVEHITGTVNDFYKTEKVKPATLNCNEDKKFESGFRIVSYMKIVSEFKSEKYSIITCNFFRNQWIEP